MIGDYQSRNSTFRDKFFLIDYKLVLLILLLGFISFFAIYSTERGNFG